LARDPALESRLRKLIGHRYGLAEKGMFGGLAFLLDDHLLCCARNDGALIRLGKGNDAWALGVKGVEPMMSGARPMSGWVRARPAAFADDAFARKLVDGAIAFVKSLPPK